MCPSGGRRKAQNGPEAVPGRRAHGYQKVATFASSFADGGTYEFVGPSRITVHRLFSTNPNRVGQEFTYEYEFEGDLQKYWILQPDGSRGPMGMARRVATKG